jgi:hypothetical protein
MPDQLSLRRRFQFRLRTLMIGVTLLAVACGYVGWQAKIVRERQSALAAVKESGGYVWTREDDLASADFVAGYRVNRDEWPSEVAWLRRLLGDEHVAAIHLAWNVSLPERNRVEGLFPEAEMYWLPKFDD